jgi:two-component system chemotaxis response regulator CheB
LNDRGQISGLEQQPEVSTARRDVIAIGGSAGALDAMLAVVAGLPPDFGGSVFVVSHIGPHRSHLPEVLSRAGPLPARHAEDGESIQPGIVYIAPPDWHMLVLRDAIRLSRGPRQHFTRPAIDPLFRSLAQSFGPRVVGVVLSGLGSDGARGLREIRQAGGVAVIQEHSAAPYPEMPRNAAAAVRVDHIAAKDELPGLLLRLSSQTVHVPETATAGGGSTIMDHFERPVALTCPECGGALRRADGPPPEFRCHTGHHFGATEIADGQGSALEGALVVALRVLNERAELCRQMMESARAAGRDLGVAYWKRLKSETEEQLEILVRFLERQPQLAEAEPNGEPAALEARTNP